MILEKVKIDAESFNIAWSLSITEYFNGLVSNLLGLSCCLPMFKCFRYIGIVPSKSSCNTDDVALSCWLHCMKLSILCCRYHTTALLTLSYHNGLQLHFSNILLPTRHIIVQWTMAWQYLKCDASPKFRKLLPIYQETILYYFV